MADAVEQHLLQKLEGIRQELERIGHELPFATTEDAHLRRMVQGLMVILPMAMGQITSVEAFLLEREAAGK